MKRAHHEGGQRANMLSVEMKARGKKEGQITVALIVRTVRQGSIPVIDLF